MIDKKIKVLTISDNPLSVSGVAHQARNMIEGLLDSGVFQIVSIAWEPKAKVKNFSTHKGYGEDWKLHFTANTQDKLLLRSLLREEKPDIVWIMTDPRQFKWLFEIETEVRYNCPIVYYHVWDNWPLPEYNKPYYQCCDEIVSISKLTHEIVKELVPEKDAGIIPHSVDHSFFYKDLEEGKIGRQQFGLKEDEYVFLWVNRNGYRKMAQTVLEAFSVISKKNPKCKLVMKTDPLDPYGPNLYAVAEMLNIKTDKLMFLTGVYDPKMMNRIYNMSDSTIHIAHNEGFGLTCLESLNTGTPVIANLTGGLKDQVDQGTGIALKPSFSVLKGSQDTPYIREDYVSVKDLVKAMKKIMNFKQNRVEVISELCRFKAESDFNYEDYKISWIEKLIDVHEKHGSYQTRKNYVPFHMEMI